MNPRNRRPRGERGTAAAELAVAAPVLMLIVMLTVAGGRLALAHGGVEQAAADAARSASIARTPEEASSNAAAAAAAGLANHLTCASTNVSVDTSGFALPVGTPAIVSVTVVCTVTLTDLGVPALPGQRAISATAVNALDTYRGRS